MNPCKEFKEVVKGELKGLIQAGSLPAGLDLSRVVLGHPIVAFSAPMRENDRARKAFLFEHMYRHERVNRMTARARCVVRDLFGSYMRENERMPDEWRAAASAMPASDLPRLIGDYIAGMTDRFAIEEHRAIFGASDLTSVSPSL